MAFVQIVAQANRSTPATQPPISSPAGTLGCTPWDVIPVGTTLVSYRLTSSNWPVTTDTITWAMDRSDDAGATIREITNGVTTEGALSRRGDMPGILNYAVGGSQNGQPVPTDHEVWLRVRYGISGSLRFGVERELV